MFEIVRDYAAEHPAKTAGMATGAFAAGIGAAYKLLQPEKSDDPGDNYFEIIANLDECIQNEEDCKDVQYLMLGGGASAALAHEGTEIDVENRRIIPPKDIKKRQYREENGTKADVDILVVSNDEEAVKAVRRALTPDDSKIHGGTHEEQVYELDKPGARLKIGVTGLMSGAKYWGEDDSMLGQAVRLFKKDWVSQRVQYADPDKTRTVAIADVEVELPEDYFEPWEMVLKDGGSVSVPHPLLQVLFYLSRASHGVREKRDGKKVDDMMRNVGPVFGTQLIWSSNRQTARVVSPRPQDPGVRAAMTFVDEKNALRYSNTKERMGKFEAGLLAAKIAIHRKLDTWEFVRALGQDGLLYDKVISKFSGEDQS